MNELNYTVLQKALELVNLEPVLVKIRIPKFVQSISRKAFYEAIGLGEPEDKKISVYSVSIVESEVLPNNMLIFDFSDESSKVFIFKDGKVYQSNWNQGCSPY